VTPVSRTANGSLAALSLRFPDEAVESRSRPLTRISKIPAGARNSGREPAESALELVGMERADDEYQRLIEWWTSSMRGTRDRASTAVSRTVIHDG
jgi:hypothetical protein